MKLSFFSEKFGSLGAIISAMGCASCFPLLGSFGAAIGLGFLARFEGLFINTLLPVFAVLALISTIISWISHRQHLRLLVSIAGPLMILATLYLFWTDSWSTNLFYFALILMLAVAIWDFISPASRSCQTKHQNEFIS